MRLTRLLLGLLLVTCGCSESNSTIPTSTSTATPSATVTAEAGYVFAAPVRLEAEGEVISVEAPGFACPTVADVDQDGNPDLVVGQFRDGAMQLFRNVAAAEQEPTLVAAGWIQSGEQRAVVPGVW